MRKWSEEAVGNVVGTAIVAACLLYVAGHVAATYLRARGGAW